MTMLLSLSRRGVMGLHGHLLAHVMLDSQCMLDDEHVMEVTAWMLALDVLLLDLTHSDSTM